MGSEAARFVPVVLGRGGRVVLARGGEFGLRPSSIWRERYALLDGEHELATFECSTWGGKRPVRVTVTDGAAPEPLVMLFAGWLVKKFGDDAGAAAGGATVAVSA